MARTHKPSPRSARKPVRPTAAAARGRPGAPNPKPAAKAKPAAKPQRRGRDDTPREAKPLPAWWHRTVRYARFTFSIGVLAGIGIGAAWGLRWADRRATQAWYTGDLPGWSFVGSVPDGADSGHPVKFAGPGLPPHSLVPAWMPNALDIQTHVDGLAASATHPFDPKPLRAIADVFDPPPGPAGTAPLGYPGWIDGNLRVSRSPDGSIQVHATWRTPAAAVRTPRGLVRISAQGLPLPGLDTPDAALLPWLDGYPVNGEPARFDLPWPAPDVAAAVDLLAFLDRPIGDPPGGPPPGSRAKSPRPTFRSLVAGLSVRSTPSGRRLLTIHTTLGQRLDWGGFPALSERGEITDAGKLAHLRDAYHLTGTLSAATDQLVDITGPIRRLISEPVATPTLGSVPGP